MMKKEIAIVCVLLAVCSCAEIKNPASVWRRSDAALSERFHAAQSLISRDMLITQVEGVLGKPTERFRHSPGGKDRINWWYNYAFTDGTIRLHFLQVMDAPTFPAEFQSMQMTTKEANHTSEGIRQPADGSPKPSM